MEKITCINDSNKPNDISSKNWVKFGEEYTPIKLVTCKLDGKQYFVLKEIAPDNQLYGGYNIIRFGIDITNLIEMVEKGELVEEIN